MATQKCIRKTETVRSIVFDTFKVENGNAPFRKWYDSVPNFTLKNPFGIPLKQNRYQ